MFQPLKFNNEKMALLTRQNLLIVQLFPLLFAVIDLRSSLGFAPSLLFHLHGGRLQRHSSPFVLLSLKKIDSIHLDPLTDESTGLVVNGGTTETASNMKTKRVKAKKSTTTATEEDTTSSKEERNVEPWHWTVDTDIFVLETRRCEETGKECGNTKKTSKLHFKIHGNPRPLRRHRLNTKRGVMMYNPSGPYQLSFQKAVADLIFTATSQDESDDEIPIQGPLFSPEENLVMTIIFRMKRPKSHFVGGKPGPDRLKKSAPPQKSTLRQDVDNLTKFILDSMNSFLYEDDKQIMSLHVTKLLDNDGFCKGSTEICIRSIHDDDDLESIIADSFSM